MATTSPIAAPPPRLAGGRPGPTGEAGFTLVEMLVAMIVLMIGIVATFGVFSSSKNSTLFSQRHEVAVHQAQREMERLRSLRYTELGMKAPLPQPSTDPTDPNFRLRAGDKFFVKTNPPPCGGGQPPCNLEEDLVGGGHVEPGPEAFTVGEGSAAVTGKIYRYITWRDENCPATICDGSQNTKRLFVAATIDAVAGRPNIGPKNPVWLSSIAIDPNDGPAGGGGQPPAAPPSAAQSFYLYDKTCSDDDANNSYSSPPGPPPASGPRPGDHPTHDTAAPATSCENIASKRPDLMGPALPTYAFSSPVPPYKFSDDLGLPTDYPAGLAMAHTGASNDCPVSSYGVGSDAQGVPGKYQVHAWSTRKFSQDFSLSGSAFISLWTTSVGTQTAAGQFCATLIDRQVIAGVPNDLTLGSMSRTYNPWPTTKNEPGRTCGTSDFPCGRQLTFQFNLTGTTVRAGGRLVLLVSVLGSSGKDIVLLYDDPRYRSLLQVETSTPCNSSGTPCSDS